MALLAETGEEALFVGDIIRLPDNYDLGPDTGPVDLIVFEPNDEECGLGLLVISGYKSGLIYALLPTESMKGGSRAICIDWLRREWDRWFCYAHGDGMKVMDLNKTRVFGWDKREIVETA
ncbi:Imm45 family immunity protein [Gellertiella hungarica]|uniref:Immunity protein 45 domain-containing protein n=1 Tax=Gellertiella hungarica TaxID=1572859 RepID=A0A7W6NI55_9HYPH|nr:Imm45 family immunity protein [Gellertiella hungarica]MBB4063020.1 hypothetical protein [Gellertiella hungarica]